MEGKGRSYYDRSLIIYHIHKVDDVLPMEVLVNNVLIFQSALYDDSSSGSSRGSVQGSGTFCLFNIISETELHPLMKYLDTNQTTRGLAIWSASPGETYSHLMTLKWLSTFIKQNFATVFFTSSYVRGPLAGREDGRWISQFRKPLVMLKTTMLGAVRQCSGSGSGEGGGGGSGEGSVVTSHFYGIQTKILTDLLKKWQPENRDAESCHILDTIVQAGLDQEDCDYLTFSSLGNIYGHEVVANLRLQATVSKPLLKMMFIPMNSHHYLDLDDSLRKLMKNWEQRCIGLYTQTQINLLACTVQPRPVKGRVDLSAVFFHRNSLKQEGGHFPGDSLVEYLATQRMWTYDRLPIDGIQSMVFLHPSPLWCLASGNVWYAPPFGYDPRCYSQATAEKLRRQEQRGSSSSGGGSNARRKLDWEHFDSTQRLCLRHKP
eukprot:gene4102-4494_t